MSSTGTTTNGSRAFAGPTASKATRVVGLMALAGIALLLPLALLWSPPEIDQADAVRLFYVHVPSATVALYLAFGVTCLGSLIYLRNQSVFWDLMAHASAEIGVVFCGFVLITGMLWGRPTWGVYWEWDPRITSTAITLILYLGYLALRRMDLDPTVRSKRAAFLGIISFCNLFIIKYSVEWWRGLHQGQTIGIDTQLDGLMLFTFAWGMVTFVLIFAWLLMHRFRLGWLELQATTTSLDDAIAARRAESPQLTGEGL